MAEKENEEKVSEGDKEKKEIAPEGVWLKCKNCDETILKNELERNLYVCPECDFHMRISADFRIRTILDEGSFEEIDEEVTSIDPLNFTDRKKYVDRIVDAREKTGRPSAILTGTGSIEEMKVAFGAMDFGFIGGSMGSVVGEKVARLIERSIEEELPLIIVSATGGARMQEGILSLMQMAKTNARLAEHNEKNLLYISVCAHPTTAGVMASYAAVGDIVIAEPGALMGFAGPRVIKETIRQDLPEGFQRAKFMMEKGFVDIISHRRDLRDTISRLLKILVKKK